MDAIYTLLLDPFIWQEPLERFAAATNLAVLLTDTDGRPLGKYINRRPTWSMLSRERSLTMAQCPFCIEPDADSGACISDALEAKRTVLTVDGCGLVHLIIPLFFGNKRLGAILAGQVFDRYPDHLSLHTIAQRLNVSSSKLWQSARLEFPIRRQTLEVYGRLLETFGNTFLQARYQTIQQDRQMVLTKNILEDTKKELNAVQARLASAHEEEHERLAIELHDTIGQGMVLVQFDIHEIRKAITNNGPSDLTRQLNAPFEAISLRIQQLANEVRHLSHELHPSVLTDLGLEEATRQLARNAMNHHSLAVEFVARDIPVEIESTVSLGVYRIIQEAVQNSIKHSGSTTAAITLIGTPTCLEIAVEDSGNGFDATKIKRGIGLINMAHRAELLGGKLEVESNPGQGTKVYARVPIGRST